MYHYDLENTNSFKSIHLFYTSVILLLGVGLVTLYSASYAFAQRFFWDGRYFFNRQAIFAAIGLVLFFVSCRVNLDIVRKFILPMVGFAIFLNILALVPGFGVERYGATRWIGIGSFSYQPSEMVKFVLPLYLAHLLDKKGSNIDNFYSGFFTPVLVTGAFFILIHFQNNFSTAALIMFLAMIIFYLAGMRYRYFLSALALLVPISALLVFTREYRVTRLVSFLRPGWDPLGAGFQVNASREAIVSGGFWGRGLGEGTRKIASIPEIHSDFVFSSYVEETGFIGMVLFFALFAVFASLGYKAAMLANNTFDRLLAAGLTSAIIAQTLLNVAVVSGAVPVTGVPLPFFSAGGSSLITTLISAGLIANVLRRNCPSNLIVAEEKFGL